MKQGFSHIGVSTHDMQATIRFYEQILGFRRVADERIRIRQGGVLRQVSFDVGHEQYIVFMEAKGVPGISDSYDTGINGALGVPSGMYHVALKLEPIAALHARLEELKALGVQTSPIIDLGAAQSIFLHDPNGIQLEISCQTRPFDDSDLRRESDASIAL